MRPCIDHSVLSPSGHVSKRSREAALRRVSLELFGPEGLQQAPTPQPSERERDLRQAAQLRELAGRGMKPRAYLKEAQRLEALWN